MSTRVAPDLPPPPATLPAWAKVLWYLTESAGFGIAWKAFEFGQEIGAALADEPAPAATVWRKFVVRAEDTVSGDSADDQIFTVDIVNYTNGSIDPTWTQTDHEFCANRLQEIATGYTGSMPTRLSFVDIKAYEMAFRPYTDPKPFAISGAPVYAVSIAGTGTGGTSAPPQPCIAITERTPSRPNWGRFYLPTITGASLDPSGRMNRTIQDSLLAAIHLAYQTLMDNQYFPVVPTTSIGSTKTVFRPGRTLQGVTAVSLDDVTDVIRRRRFAHSSYTAVMPLDSTQQLPALEPDELASSSSSSR